MMQEVLLFPTVIHEYDLSNHPDLPVLRSIVDQLKFDELRLIANSTYLDYQGDGNVLNNPKLANLRAFLEGAVSKWAETVGCRPIYIDHSWLNRYKRGDRVDRHRHEMSIASAAFFIHADPGSCALTFHSPLEQLRMFECSTGSTFYNENYHSFEAQTGRLIIFPSWLPHDTVVNESDLRITLSFNTTYQGKDFQRV
jgi:uncharacterized protein (TIGR02466 family)